MSFTHTRTQTLVAPSGTISNTKSYTGTANVEIDEAVDNGASNTQFALNLTVAQIQSIEIVSDQAITLRFNSTGAPAPLMALVAGKAYEWDTDAYFTNLLTTNITTLYISNASGVTANFKLRCVYNA